MDNNTGIKKYIPIIATVAGILLVMGLVGVMANSSGGGGGGSGGNAVYLKYNGKNITSSKREISFFGGEEYRFDVLNALTSDGSIGYMVEILPNTTEDTDFIFTRNGNEYRFSEVEELKSAFEITEDSDGFTITPPGNMLEVLSRVYPQEEVWFDGEKNGCYFVLAVYDKDRTSEVKVFFGLDRQVDGIELETEEVLF